MSLKTVCTCGHDIDTHYRDLTTGERCTCLGRGCDCKKYDDALKEKPQKALTFHAPYEGYTKPKRRPHKDTSCKCDACREFDAPYEVTLYPDDGWSPPWTYQLGERVRIKRVPIMSLNGKAAVGSTVSAWGLVSGRICAPTGDVSYQVDFGRNGAGPFEWAPDNQIVRA